MARSSDQELHHKTDSAPSHRLIMERSRPSLRLLIIRLATSANRRIRAKVDLKPRCSDFRRNSSSRHCRIVLRPWSEVWKTSSSSWRSSLAA